MHMYHSWGGQNAWLRQIQARNPLFIARKLGERLGLADGDWVWIESPHGQVKAEIKLMEGVNQDTVWTWNAIGKRARRVEPVRRPRRNPRRASCSTT